MRSTVAKPLETVLAACSQAGGVLATAISAGRYSGPAPRAVLQLGDQRLDLDYAALYSLFAGLGSSILNAGSSGFKPMFGNSPFAKRAAAQADARPPFGLFTCGGSGGTQLWAVAIMPESTSFGYDLPVKVTPVTRDWIRNRRMRAAKLADTAERTRAAASRQQQLDTDHAKAEALRLRPFRSALKIGSRTNCGIVIAVRDPVVQVQLPPQITGPSGIRDFWAPREELTDATPPDGCRFGS